MSKDQDKNKVNAKVIELEAKVAELTSGWQRAQADLSNYRRQADEDRKKLIKCANSDLVMEILPVLDNFQLAAKHVPQELEDNNWTKGIRQIEKQLENILAIEGLKKIETIGQEFDPQFHEAIEHIENERPEDEIVEEIAPGYLLHDDVLRPAKVKVSKGKN